MPSTRSARFHTIGLIVVLLVSGALKLFASQMLAWDADFVPVLARGQAWLDGGNFPVVGTLSSVAAFNMPFLVWMQIPALILTRDVQLALVGTQLVFNLLGTVVLYRLGGLLFDRRAGLLAAMLFSFSEIGISGSYTAWAQLQLPGFYALTALCLFLWKREGRNWQIALTCIVATAAFMTHFSAVMLYAVIAVFCPVLRLPLNRRGLLAGLVLSGFMLMPYLAYDAQFDFVNLKAFVTRRSTLSAEALAAYAHLKPDAQPPKMDSAPENNMSASSLETAQSSRLERAVSRAQSIPQQFIAGLRLALSVDLISLRRHHPILHGTAAGLRVLLEASFVFAIIHAVHHCANQWRREMMALPAETRGWKRACAVARHCLADSAAGNNLMLLLFVSVIAAGLVLVRAGPDGQASYYAGLVGLQYLICCYGLRALAPGRRLRIATAALVLLYVSLGAFDRIVRVSTHDRAANTPLNLNLYSNLSDAATWIASDSEAQTQISVSYDLLPELKHMWWIVPWHTIDESYRFGMALDYLLESYYGMANSNRNPAGDDDNPDYTVTSAPGLKRYDLTQYQAEQFGALFVLKPDKL